MSNKPLFVVSLDFELFWGMSDKVSLEEYGKNIAGAHEAIPEILELFKQYGIHATWATVGMLMCENKDELLSLLPSPELRPAYHDPRASNYYHLEHDQVGNTVDDDPYHYGAYLVRKITTFPYQELGSHTFSHYYVQDGSENGEAIFAADCKAFAAVAQKFNAQITSIVFPRNQTTKEALTVCEEQGYTAYRGTPEHFLYSGKKEKEQTNIFLRLLRLIDAYIPISGHHTFEIAAVNRSTSITLINVPGSFFLRPYSPRLRFLEKLKLMRIKRSMTHAAKNGEVCHLWWHPHNFGINRRENLRNLKSILEHFVYLQKKYNMQSASMSEASSHARADESQ